MPKSLGRRKNKLARPSGKYDHAGNEIGDFCNKNSPDRASLPWLSKRPHFTHRQEYRVT